MIKVWTNGCFDILHRGHIEMFEYAKSLGDVVRQRVGQPHQLEAITDGVVFEVSTQHFDEDSYRVIKGDTQ